jgi:hypothetical protein
MRADFPAELQENSFVGHLHIVREFSYSELSLVLGL